MHPGALRALEFDRIVEAVVRLAHTPLGAARLAELRPETDPRTVAAALAATAETARFLDDHDLALRAPEDLDAILTALAVQGRALEPMQLLGLASLFTSIDAACGVIRGARQRCPLLAGVADGAASFARECADIHRRIDAGGAIQDDASPELRSIRERLRKQRARLRGTLESYLRGRDTSKYLQQQIVTDRNGRYVLVVRAEHRSAIPGIVHGSSASGASLFLEPLSTVEINNDIVALEQQEQEEIRRILLALSDAFRARAADVIRTMEAATEIDVLQARARFSREIGGIEPAIVEDGALELRAARHPLLVLRRGDAPVVPVDILLVPPTRVLVITGPNTGGKTVALKTAGLLPLMAQAGLLIPAADGSRVPVFRTVFADIGDEQSIAEDLSTFSAHVSNIVAMDRALLPPALVLLDEAGTGTDPNEGGALAMAIIDHFRRRDAMVVATTHFDALKTYASTTDGVASAGFGFDPETFAPTYRLTYGSPGSSLALEIAERLGLPAEIIGQARAHRGERETQLADHLAKLERELAALDHERRLVAREQQTIDETASRLQAREQDLRSREESFRRRLDQRLEERLREARREIDQVVDALKTRTASLAADAERRAARLVPTGESGAARAEARAALDAVEERLRAGLDPAPAAPAFQDGRPAAVGDRVQVGPLRLEGIVQAVHGREAEVDVRGKRLRARVEELRVIVPAAAATAAPGRVRVNVDLQPRDGVASEINVVGCTVDEAIARVERLLDDAMIAEQHQLRVIHGYGTGQLRRAIGGYLQSHPFVAHHTQDPDNGGVTVVDLKE